MNLQNATVVVTGASSGIGRATALEFAKAGANVVLASRGVEALKSVAAECQELGAKTDIFEMDITEALDVRALAAQAVKAFNGRIDVWVNDPGIGVIGEFEKVPIADHDRVIQTNLIGYMHGLHAVLPYMKAQNAGVVINLNSLGAFLPSPYGVAYTASKFGLRGMTEALRGELRHFKDIHVCDLFPGFVNSPGVSHGANFSGVELKPVKPLISSERVAKNVVALAQRPQPQRLLGSVAYLSRLGYFLAPKLTVNSVAKFMEFHFQNGTPTTDSEGTLFKPSPKRSGVDGKYDLSYENRVIVGVTFGMGLALIGLAALGGTLLANRQGRSRQTKQARLTKRAQQQTSRVQTAKAGVMPPDLALH